MITLSERIKLELRHRDPIEITELILDNSKATDIEGISNDYKNLRQLSLVNVGLTSLKNFPYLPSLEKLDLSDNRISTGLEYLNSCPNLNQLFLTNNKLRSINEIRSLSLLTRLETLDLSNCELTQCDNYRKQLFEMIPSLKCLDGYFEFEESCDYESEDEYYEEDSYENCYESEDDEEDEDHNNCVENKQTNGKRGKCESKVKYSDQDNFSDYLVDSIDLYSEEYQNDSTNDDIFEATDINCLDDDTEDDDELNEYKTDEDNHFMPPSHGSKFAPFKAKDGHKSLKRSYSYEDDYDTPSKFFFQETESYSPHIDTFD